MPWTEAEKQAYLDMVKLTGDKDWDLKNMQAASKAEKKSIAAYRKRQKEANENGNDN